MNDPEAHREANDLWFGDPSFVSPNGGHADVCATCAHTLTMHVHHPGTLGACSTPGCGCAQWERA